MLISYRAYFHTGTAGGARPDDIFRDYISDYGASFALSLEQPWTCLQQMLLKFLD